MSTDDGRPYDERTDGAPPWLSRQIDEAAGDTMAFDPEPRQIPNPDAPEESEPMYEDDAPPVEDPDFFKLATEWGAAEEDRLSLANKLRDVWTDGHDRGRRTSNACPTCAAILKLLNDSKGPT
jgi:hypothetical protein